MDALEQFAANVRRLRDERGLTQEQLADRAGLDLSYVAKIETCRRSPGIRIVAQLAKGLEIDAGQLFEDVEP